MVSILSHVNVIEDSLESDVNLVSTYDYSHFYVNGEHTF